MSNNEVKREIIRRLSYKGEEEVKKEEPKVEEKPKEEAPASIIKREVVRRLSYKGEEEPPKPVAVDESNMPGFTTAETFRYETALLTFMIGLMIVLYACCAKVEIMEENFNNLYQMYIGIVIMMFFGFGYLMCFLKRYGMGAVGFTMLITVLGILWGILVESFFEQAAHYGEWHYVEVDLPAVVDSLFLVAAILISYGGIIGKVSPLQLVFMAVVETIFYSINKQCLLLGVVDFVDAGGTINIHMFGAYFGLAVAWIIGKPGASAESEGGHVADLFSLIGTIFLWIYWPSFNGGFLEPDSPQQQRAIINTILGLCAATIGAFIMSSTFSYSKKIRPVDIQNATLSGGVAMGAICDMTLRPSDSLLIGLAAGCLSTYGYVSIQAWLEVRVGIHDTCGIHNLHGLPSVLGTWASIILTGYKGRHMHDVPGVLKDSEQWKDQFVAHAFTLSMAILSGLGTGFFMYFLRPKENTEFFTDSPYWEIMDDFGRSFEEVLSDLAKEWNVDGYEAAPTKDSGKHVEMSNKSKV
jgi:ammonium transporter Rh